MRLGSLQKKPVQNPEDKRYFVEGREYWRESIGEESRKFCDDACHASVMAAVGGLSSVIDEI